MSITTTYSTLSRQLLITLVLLFSAAPALADDMWDGVFAYQKKMADYGHPEAQVKLGEMYEHGNGTEQDYGKAKEWYQKAADQGFEPAKQKLAGLEERRKQAAEAKKRAEQERIAREKAIARQKAEAAERARLERERKLRQAREAEQKRLAEERAAQAAEQKARKAEEERLARERAQEAIKKMMATPEAYTEE